MKKTFVFAFILSASLQQVALAQPKQGKELIDSLLGVLSNIKEIEDTNKINVLISLGKASLNINEYEKSFGYCKEALSFSEKLNFKKGKSNAYHIMGMGYSDLGNYPESLKNYFAALKIREEIGDKRGIAGTSNNIGFIFMNQGNYPQALNMFFKALKINEEIDNKDWISSNYNNIGIVYFTQKQYPEALKNYYAALKIRKQLGDRPGQNHPYNNIGNVFYSQGKYPEALENYKMSLEIRQEMGDQYEIGYSLANVGVVYDVLGDYSEALKYHYASLKISNEIDNMDGKATAFNNIGNVKYKMKEYEKAKLYYDSTFAIARVIGNPDLLRTYYEAMAQLDSTTGNYKSSLQNYKLSIQYRDSLVNDENKKQLVQQQMQYDFDKKEAATKTAQEKKDALAKAEIKRQTLIRNATFGGVGIVGIFIFFLIRSTSRRRKTSFEKQVSQVEMKALRAQMNPHFIFNSLNSIHSFIQQNRGEKASDYLIKFSRLMRLILENSNHEEVPLESDLEALSLYMELEAARMNNKFTFSIDVDPGIDIENTLVPPLILQPFVENSIWHGMMHKEENGLIQINISKEGDMIKCIVEDNGVGRERAKELKSTTQKGKHKSLGMKITNERIAIINRIKKSKAFVALKDLHDEAKRPLGTLVEVQLPLETGF